MKKFAIIGSGVSGISCAYYLNKHGYDFDIIESSDIISGRAGKAVLDQKNVDVGGKNIGHNYKLFREFVSDQGSYQYEYFGVNTSKIKNGKLVSISREKNMRSLFNLLKLASIKDLIKILIYSNRIKKNLDEGLIGSTFYNKLSDKYDKFPISHYFSSKCVRNLIRPITIRMNGAEPNECYLGNFGSNIRSAFDKYDQLSNGLDNVLSSFCKKTNIILNTEVIEVIHKKDEINLRVFNHIKKEEETLSYSGVIIATPAYVTKEIIKKLSVKAYEALDNIKYFPVGIAIAKYKNPVFNSNIRAVVFDEKQPISNMGAYGINDLNIVRYTFSGKFFREKYGQNLTQEQAISIAEELSPLEFKINKNERISYIYSYWDKGLCAYSQYHHKNIQTINNTLSQYKNIYIAGDYIYGASIEACFYSGKKVIEKILESNNEKF